MEGFTDIILFQNNRAKHLFSVYSIVNPTVEDEAIKYAIKMLRESESFFYPFFDLKENFSIMIRSDSEENNLIFDGFKELKK